ncbi:MAG: hypothetical protein MZW92_74390 [Comamonadaceae bacterium]|nr:hypothetical protein [Comamonadaceae bacterium]
MGYGARDFRSERRLLLAVPFVVALSFFFIADIDGPRSATHPRVVPQNLLELPGGVAGAEVIAK